MSIEVVLKQVIAKLVDSNMQFALAGGIVASIYRIEKRLTADIDIALAVTEDFTLKAKNIINSIGLRASVVTNAQLEGGPVWAIKRGKSPDCIVVGRDPNNSEAIGVDLLLPNLAWVPDAVRRAQKHKLNLGFGAVPCITVEDLILAKLDALQDKATRYKDLDDLQSILMAKHELDLPYLIGKMQELQLALPKQLYEAANFLIVRASKKIARMRSVSK